LEYGGAGRRGAGCWLVWPWALASGNWHTTHKALPRCRVRVWGRLLRQSGHWAGSQLAKINSSYTQRSVAALSQKLGKKAWSPATVCHPDTIFPNRCSFFRMYLQFEV